MINNVKNTINIYLDKKGFTPPIQRVIKFNGFLVFLLFTLGLMAMPVNSWLFWLSSGAILSFLNFFFLAHFVQKMFHFNKISQDSSRSFMMIQIIMSNLRLFITGIILYTLLVVWNADPFALIIGLTVPIAMIPILLLSK